MAGSAAARELSGAAARSHAAPGPARRIDYRLAGPRDDDGVRRLLRENPFDGRIRLSFECEPDAFAAGRIYGPTQQTLIACDTRSDRLVGMALRAERSVFVNGVPQRLGYLGQLRLDGSVRRRPRLLADGFDALRSLHRRGDVPAYLVSIVDDNRPARRLLTGRGFPGAPTFTPLEPLAACAIPVWQGAFARTRTREQNRVEEGRAELAAPIAECLRRTGARHQFFPVWAAADLASAATPGLRITDFLVRRDGDRVTACAALWDQRSFRQTIVRGYSPWLSRIRPLLNAAGLLTGLPSLPDPGTSLPFAYLSHFAVERDDERCAAELIEAALSSARGRGLHYIVIGLAARHPLVNMIGRRFRHRRYVSHLYLAHWPDGEDFVRAVDGRVPHPEIAVL